MNTFIIHIVVNIKNRSSTANNNVFINLINVVIDNVLFFAYILICSNKYHLYEWNFHSIYLSYLYKL